MFIRKSLFAFSLTKKPPSSKNKYCYPRFSAIEANYTAAPVRQSLQKYCEVWVFILKKKIGCFDNLTDLNTHTHVCTFPFSIHSPFPPNTHTHTHTERKHGQMRCQDVCSPGAQGQSHRAGGREEGRTCQVHVHTERGQSGLFVCLC